MSGVLIIGCGKIAGLWEDLNSNNTYGHASAYLKNGQFQLLGCVDTDINIAKQFASKYSIENVCVEPSKLLLELHPEVVSICTPDNTHYQTAKNIIENNSGSVKVLFIEKPVCSSLKQFDELAKLSDESGILFVVNHSRRFHPLYRQLKKLYTESKFGELIRADSFYYGGWKHNGVHLIDTMSYLFSEELYHAEVMEEWPSHYEDDSTYTVRAKLGKDATPVWFHGFNEDYYQLFDIDLKFDKGRLRILNFEEECIWDNVYVNSMQEKVLQRGKIALDQDTETPIEEAVKIIGQYMISKDSSVFDGVLLKDIRNSMQILWNVIEKENA